MATAVHHQQHNSNPSSTESNQSNHRINEEFMNSLFKETDADSVHAIVTSLEKSAKRLRELEAPKGMRGFNQLPVDYFEERVLQGRETFSAPKASGITKQHKTKKDTSKKGAQDKYHNNLLVKYSKDFFEKLSKNTTVAQKKEIVSQLEKSWGFKSELRSNAHAADYVNYIRKVWIKYCLGKLSKQADGNTPSQTTEPTAAPGNYQFSKHDIDSLFDLEKDIKDKQSIVEAFKRSANFFHEKNFEHVLRTHIEPSILENLNEQFDLQPMNHVTKKELEKEKLDDLMEIENISENAKTRRKHHKVFQERFLNKISMPFYEKLKKAGADVLRDVISDLALEWLFQPHLKLHTDDGLPVPTDDVVNYLRHIWIMRIRGKLEVDHRELARLLSEREKEVAKFCKDSMENLHKSAIEHANENEGRPVVKKDEWDSLESNIENKVREVFDEIKSKVYPSTSRK